MSKIWPNGGSLSPSSPGNGRPGQFQSTNEFGTPHDLTGTHRGIDLINFTDIHAVDDGKVVFSGHNGTAGYEIKIRHTDLTATRYLHMEFGSLKFITGDYVKKGDIIGKMGATGYVTGKHLHFECIDPDTITRINPRKYINPAAIVGGGAVPFDPEEDMPTVEEILDYNIARQGGATGTTNLRQLIAWQDANLNKINDLLKALPKLEAIINAVYNTSVERKGGMTGPTTLAATLAWQDANLGRIINTVESIEKKVTK